MTFSKSLVFKDEIDRLVPAQVEWSAVSLPGPAADSIDKLDPSHLPRRKGQRQEILIRKRSRLTWYVRSRAGRRYQSAHSLLWGVISVESEPEAHSSGMDLRHSTSAGHASKHRHGVGKPILSILEQFSVELDPDLAPGADLWSPRIDNQNSTSAAGRTGDRGCAALTCPPKKERLDPRESSFEQSRERGNDHEFGGVFRDETRHGQAIHSTVSQREHFQNFVAIVVDHLDCDLAGGGFREGTADGAVEG